MWLSNGIMGNAEKSKVMKHYVAGLLSVVVNSVVKAVILFVWVWEVRINGSLEQI